MAELKCQMAMSLELQSHLADLDILTFGGDPQIKADVFGRKLATFKDRIVAGIKIERLPPNREDKTVFRRTRFGEVVEVRDIMAEVNVLMQATEQRQRSLGMANYN